MAVTTPRDLHDFMRGVRKAFADRKAIPQAGPDATLTEAWLEVASAQCKSDFWEQTSQLEVCTQYNPGRSNTAAFECTYCCAGDNCNAFDLEPDGSKSNGYASACFVNPSLFLRW